MNAQKNDSHSTHYQSGCQIFIWFTGPLAKLVNRIVPERPEEEGIQPLFLDEMYLEQPALALDQVRREIVRLAELDRELLNESLTVATSGSRDDIGTLSRAHDDVDKLYGEIGTYLGKLSQKNLVKPQPKQLSEFIAIANYLEDVDDVIESNRSAAFQVETGIIEILKRLNTLTRRIARSVFEVDNGEVNCQHEPERDAQRTEQ